MGHLAVVRCLIEELGANVNQAAMGGTTPLIAAAHRKHHNVIAYLLKHGADAQISAHFGTAAENSKVFGAPDKQTAYLEAKTHCSNSGCNGAGIKKCTACKQVWYCGEQCQLLHWPTHKSKCKEVAKNMATAGD
jgi:ankyrin repeat protein